MASGNGASGEAFVAVSPDGTEYQFDWLVSRVLTALSKGSTAPQMFSTSTANAGGEQSLSSKGAVQPTSTSTAVGIQPTPTAIGTPSLPRVEIWILPTRVTDRFGNTVTYNYDATNKWQLKSIVASDGRSIALSYVTGTNLVSSVFDGTRTWRYTYDRNDRFGQLQTVTLPDGSAWQLGGIAPLMSGINYLGSGSCEVPGNWSSQERTGSMTHPAGATGTFTLTPTRHGRAGVFQDCRTGVYPEPSEHTWYPKNFDIYALTKKTLSGPGLSSSLTWRTQYPVEQSSWAPCNGCVATKTVTVTDPAGNATQHTFGTLFRETEGQLLRTDIFSASGENLRSTSLRYKDLGAYGYSLQPRGDGDMAARIMENDRREITQQDTTFVWEVLNYAAFAQPATVSRSSSMGYSRTEYTEYNNNLAKWIMGQVSKITELNTGKVMMENQYDPTTSVLLNTSKFGKLQQSMTYNADGTLRTVADGKNQVTTFSNYMRGIAQRIDYQDGTFEQAAVNNFGKVTSLTNEAGTSTTLGYDGMGRLASITHPQEAGLTYNTTSVIVSQINAQEFDLAPGHWRQMVVSGTAAEVNYYDALLRPIYTERWDDADRPGTMRRAKHQYDFAGRTTYESYPKDDWGDVSSDGAYFQYDALGRPTTNTRVSELGNLYENYTYHPGFVKRFVDAKGNGISYWHQAFDEPSEDKITGMSISEGVSVTIGRDIFGKPTTINRGGNGVNATRTYVYDGYERLCKTIEPETGATIQNYDAANNVTWRASGLGLTATNSCNTGDVAAAKQIAYTYDARNRLRNTTYGDGSPAIYRTYTADGLPDTVQSDGTSWTYGYNNRRLPTSETLNYGGVNYRIGRAYDANGSLSQLTYPDNSSVAYNPNALGEVRQAGGYATGVVYHPSGAIKQFSYGNGIVHTLTQNVRGLPQMSQDGYVLNDRYSYDQVANVVGITDQAEGITSRSMEYDTLNRLKRVNAPALWGDAWYNYDTLDNITSSQITGGAKARTLTHNIDYATNRLTSLSGSYGISYQYDSQGNIVQRGGQAYGFDIGNRMRSAPGVTTHAYDGLGRRTSVVGTDGVNHVYVYGQEGRLLYETTTGQALSSGTKYVYLNRHVVAEVGGSGVVYDHTDGLGSPVAKTNANAGLISRTRYEPYGATAAGTEPTIGFTGHLNAANLGLMDMQQRFYDPVAGRFLSIDPVVTDANIGSSFNRYAYANNSPYKYVDPDGRLACEDMGGNCTSYGGRNDSSPAHDINNPSYNSAVQFQPYAEAMGDVLEMGLKYYTIAISTLAPELAAAERVAITATSVVQTVKLTRAGDIGKHIVQWGEGQAPKDVAQTLARTEQINPGVVRGMIKQGLEKSWVEKQLGKYLEKLEAGGAALKNTQLKPRLELMEKILKNWVE